MTQIPPWAWLATLAILVIVARILLGRSGPGELPYFSKDFLLSKGEHAFYDVLRRSIPEGVGISMKVRLADVIGCSGAAWKEGHGGRISQKHLDFVLYDVVSTQILAAVELDDQSHQRRDRQARDDFLEQALATAGVPLLRVPAASTYDARRLRDLVRSHVEVA